jgi:hypothetical protein
LSILSDGKMCFDMKLRSSVSVGFFFTFFSLSTTLAQQSPDSILHKEYVSKIHQVYLNGIDDNAEIYHGNEYIRNGQKANGFPFFEEDHLLAGSVSYLGTVYNNLNLYYDMVSDEIIIPNYSKNALIALSPGKVDSFSIGTHVFVLLTSNSTNGLIRTGYYEQLFPGEPGVYARKEKKFVTGTGSEEAKYIQYNNYLIRYKNVFYPVDGKNSLLDILKDQEDALRKYIRTNKLNFKKNPESALVLTTIFYSQITR